MHGTRTHRRLTVRMRPLVVILVSSFVCAFGSSRPSAQQFVPASRPFPASAWAAIAHGKPADAEREARSRPVTDPDAAAVLGHLAIRKGQHDEAVRILEPAAAQSPGSTAALELGLLHLGLGRMEAGSRLLTAVVRHASTAGEPDALARAARAAQALGRAQDANALFRAASGSAGGDPAIDAAWGFLFLEKFNEAEAARSFQAVLKVDPQWAPAHVGLAAARADENPPAAVVGALRALEIDPALDSAELLLAELELDNSRYDAARERLTRVLGRNPRHLGARALLAAMAHVTGDRPEYDAELRRILGIHPSYGEALRVTADLAARHYRFDDAVALAREAIALDPTSARAHGELGLHLLRTGEETDARRALEQSFHIDRFSRVTFNLLQMLDKVDAFTVVRDGDVIVKMQADEAPVLREYAVPLARDALRTLSAKYQFTPTGPILVEIFPVHDDFAVRSVGLPGMLGALGACFGRVVTMDSPRAKPPGAFSWQATLWHEIAHVITLQMSRQRVPRWLTEGISVYEEGRARPEWGRDAEVPFALALEKGKTLPLKDLNAGFTNPETIGLAYFEASILVDHIVKTYGEAKLRTLLRAYGEGIEGDAALTSALGVSMEQLQGGFDRSVEQRFGGLRMALRAGPDLNTAAAGDPSALRAAALANPGNYAVQLAHGRALAAVKDKGAFDPLERAASLVPVAIGEHSPHAVMAQLAEQLGDDARALKEYQALLEHDHTALDPARRLAALADRAGNVAAAAIAYERIVALDPFDAAAHTGLGRTAMQANQTATAVREFTAAMALRPADLASAHCDLGEALLAAGRLAEAKREALAALEIARSYERAQDLLLQAIKSAPTGERGK
ncbi:MAG TPA: tetratricopeptide repeat protein [Vicinamibacterales bacterium]|nr:tetratricopeptide repeat protein [Vicinamibacterales bacterium]